VTNEQIHRKDSSKAVGLRNTVMEVAHGFGGGFVGVDRVSMKTKELPTSDRAG
jgi:hypothetical protein